MKDSILKMLYSDSPEMWNLAYIAIMAEAKGSKVKHLSDMLVEAFNLAAAVYWIEVAPNHLLSQTYTTSVGPLGIKMWYTDNSYIIDLIYDSTRRWSKISLGNPISWGKAPAQELAFKQDFLILIHKIAQKAYEATL